MLLTVFVCLALGAIATTANAQTFPYDHIHLSVPDPSAAADWYVKYFGARKNPEGPDRLMLGSTRLVFIKKADAKPSSGSVVDHIGFSFADLDAKMKEFEAAGIKIVTPPREAPGLFKLAFVEDPWGTRIEVMQDPDKLGLHHIHMRGPNPDDIFTWLLAKFGGERTKFKGRLHAIDHISWRSSGALAKTIDNLRAQGVTVLVEPRVTQLANGPAINIAYVAGPAGVKIEIVERPGLKPGE